MRVDARRAHAACRGAGRTSCGHRLRRARLPAHRPGHHRRAQPACRGSLPAPVAGGDPVEVPDDGQPLDLAAPRTGAGGSAAPGNRRRAEPQPDVAGVVAGLRDQRCPRPRCSPTGTAAGVSWISGGPAASPSAIDDAALLADVAPTICRALRDRQAAAFTMPATGAAVGNGPAVHPAGRAAADHRPDVRGHRLAPDTAADRTAAITHPGGRLQRRRPTAGGAGRRRRPRTIGAVDDRRQHLGDVARQPTGARRHGGQDGIAVSIEEASAGTANGPVRPLLRAQHPASGSLLDLLGRGADTRGIAVEMSISDYTVQDHLKSVFTKTSLTSRGALITTALGPPGDDARAGATAGCGGRQAQSRSEGGRMSTMPLRARW